MYLRKGFRRHANVLHRIVVDKGKSQLRILHMCEYIHGKSGIPVGKVIGEDHIAACTKERIESIHHGGQTKVGAIMQKWLHELEMKEVDHVINIICCHVILITNGVELDADSMVEDGNVKGTLHG